MNVSIPSADTTHKPIKPTHHLYTKMQFLALALALSTVMLSVQAYNPIGEPCGPPPGDLSFVFMLLFSTWIADNMYESP